MSDYQCLQCPVCTKRLSGPMNLCAGGHSVCSTCTNVSLCPICRNVILNIRNFTLEALIYELKTTGVLSNDLLQCPCPSSPTCGVMEEPYLLSHIVDQHTNILFTYSTTKNLVLRLAIQQTYHDQIVHRLLVCAGKVFKISLKICPLRVHFVIHIVGYQPGGTYEIDYKQLIRPKKYYGNILQLTSDSDEFQNEHPMLPKFLCFNSSDVLQLFLNINI
ncbi:hypothetical protein FQA39_LY05347 [Lamprigera yunnana]|nr:hypothetical protein FQA39_LY05347 [Lamprigera yunnana]